MTYFSDYDLPEPSVPEEMEPISAHPADSVIYLGVGQSVQPVIAFSDGNYHSYIANIVVTQGSSVARSTENILQITGRDIGESTVQYNILMLTDTDHELNGSAAAPTMTVRVILQLPRDELEIGAGDCLHIFPLIIEDDSGYDPGDVTWSSSDPTVVMAGQGGSSGSIYALKRGEATVTLRHNPTGAETSMKVTVGNAPTEVRFENESPLTLGIGEDQLLSVTFPEGQS